MRWQVSIVQSVAWCLAIPGLLGAQGTAPASPAGTPTAVIVYKTVCGQGRLSETADSLARAGVHPLARSSAEVHFSGCRDDIAERHTFRVPVEELPAVRSLMFIEERWRSGAECAAVVAPAPGSPAAGRLIEPRVRSFTIPDIGQEPKEVRGKDVQVLFLLSATGSVDSIRTDLEIPGAFGRKFREVLMEYRFTPARFEGCTVPAAASMKVGLSPGRKGS